MLRFVWWNLLPLYAVTTFIPNGVPRVDTSGARIDVHDGQIVQWTSSPAEYVWYGMGYGDCKLKPSPAPRCDGVTLPTSSDPCGFRLDHAVNVYTSEDLLTWTKHGDALPHESRPTGIYFRPKVIYNQRSHQYVLWVNFLPVDLSTNPDVTAVEAYANAVYLVAVSATPYGPFTPVTDAAHPVYKPATLQFGLAGDFDIVVAGSKAFIAYTATTSHKLSIEQLTDDFTDSAWVTSGQSSGVIGEDDVEAPLFFKYRSFYYLVTSPTCCFCSQGAGMFLFTSRDPLGPWSYAMNWGFTNPTDGQTSFARAQPSFVFKMSPSSANVEDMDDDVSQLMWAGDQWGISPDGTKGGTLQHWVPIAWKSSGGGVPPLPLPLTMVTGFETDHPLELDQFRTGFCSSPDVENLPSLMTCGPAMECLSSFSEPCLLCLEANNYVGAANCIPPDYSSSAAGCVADEITKLNPGLTCLLEAGGDHTQCTDILEQTFSSVSSDCQACVMNLYYKGQTDLSACLIDPDASSASWPQRRSDSTEGRPMRGPALLQIASLAFGFFAFITVVGFYSKRHPTVTPQIHPIPL